MKWEEEKKIHNSTRLIVIVLSRKLLMNDHALLISKRIYSTHTCSPSLPLLFHHLHFSAIPLWWLIMLLILSCNFLQSAWSSILHCIFQRSQFTIFTPPSRVNFHSVSTIHTWFDPYSLVALFTVCSFAFATVCVLQVPQIVGQLFSPIQLFQSWIDIFVSIPYR